MRRPLRAPLPCSIAALALSLAAVLPLAACSSGDEGGGAAPEGGGGQGAGAAGGQGVGGGQGAGAGSGGGPVCTTCTPAGPTTLALPSPAGATVWTTTTMDKVLREATPPTAGGEAITMSAARNEFEPFQVVVRPEPGATGPVTLAMSPFTGPSSAVTRVEIRRVEYVTIKQPSDASSIPSGQVPDPLVATVFGAPEPVEAGENQPFWVTVYVPPEAAPGDYVAELTISIAGKSSIVPVRLHVYGFALPTRLGFDGNWNGSMQALGGSASLEAARSLKDFFFEHRLVPSSVAWPAGLNYSGGIEYDCASASFHEKAGDPYELSQLGAEYIDGAGWNGVGFPSFEVMQFVDNSTPRPDVFCGESRGPGHQGTPAYNAAWSKLLSAIDGYLVARGWADKGYYYVQNEPQGPADYETAAFLAKLTKAAAPHLRTAISEQPRKEIAESPLAGGASYDLWWADLSEFEPAYAAARQAVGEQVWWYFLYGDAPPHFNPITIDHPGIESRIAFWGAWKYRIRGFAYYSLTGWGSDPYADPRPQGTAQNGDGFLLYPPKDGKLVTSIRWELLREGAEDTEYFLLAGGPTPSTPAEPSPVDTTVSSAVSSTTSFTRDAAALKHLRDELGRKIAGEVDGFPVLDAKPQGAHPRAPYFINFQDPQGPPAADPLVIDGHTWTKVGWDPYDAAKGSGWSGPYIGDPAIMKYQFLPDASANDLQKSIIYNDYGRTDTFSWDIEGGAYKVTVSIGWEGKTYAHHRVIVEGTPLFDDVATTPAAPYLVASAVINVSDGNVTIEAGSKDEYTMLNWVSIEPM
jgi:hypothetical protein